MELTNAATVAAMPPPWLKPNTPYPFQTKGKSHASTTDPVPSAYHVSVLGQGVFDNLQSFHKTRFGVLRGSFESPPAKSRIGTGRRFSGLF